MKMKGTKSSP